MDGTATASSGSGAVWQDAQGYVHLSDEGDIELQTKTVSPTESAQTVLADAGYYALDRVNVNAIPSNYVGSGVTQRTSSDLTASGATVTAPSGYYSSSATKTVASGSATPASSISATGATVSTGTNTLTLSKSVSNTPTVSAGYISSGTAGNSSISLTASINTRSSSDLTVSGATVTAPAGYYSSSASKSVASGTAGTPTATKGTVSNHSVSVTPSVTNTTGYITGSTKTGTAVTVTASELVSGTLSVTENGTYDVAEYADVEVSVAGASSTRTATISRSDGQSIPNVRVNGTGTRYSADEAQFTWEDGDTLSFYYGSSDYYGRIYVNGVLIHSSPTGGYYTYTPPKCDIDIQFVRDTSGERSYVYITYPYLEITSAGAYDVSDYCSVVVNISA